MKTSQHKREQVARYYRDNSEKRKEYRKRRKKQAQDVIAKLRADAACCRCGESDPCCLDFHHVDKNTKRSEVTRLGKDNGINTMMKELAKTIVLCSNCHRKLHRDEGTAFANSRTSIVVATTEAFVFEV
jgi:hypothetical protein